MSKNHEQENQVFCMVQYITKYWLLVFMGVYDMGVTVL